MKKKKKTLRHKCKQCARKTYFSKTRDAYTIVCINCGAKLTSTLDGKSVWTRIKFE